MLKIRIVRLVHAAGLDTPFRATSGASGWDIRSAEQAEITLSPGEHRKFSSGLRMQIPFGYEGQIRSRSGLSERGIIVSNSPGTIDSDYRGEVFVLLSNTGSSPHTIRRGDRIAQLIFSTVLQAVFEEVEDLSNTSRGERGFGSTGP